jgi:hypothetical protein
MLLVKQCRRTLHGFTVRRPGTAAMTKGDQVRLDAGNGSEQTIRRKNKVRKSKSIVMFVCIAAGAMVLFVQSAVAAIDVYFTITPGVGTPGSVSPDTDGHNAVYLFSAIPNQAIDITIPVTICRTGAASDGWNSIDIAFPTVAGPLSAYTIVPANQTFYGGSSSGDCRNDSIRIQKADGLAAGDYTVNINAIGGANPVPSTGSSKPQANVSPIQNIHVTLSVVQETITNESCFMTDSSGLSLMDCEGEWVTDSGSDDGRFEIVANNKKNVEVATNPGQFYYNFIWRNTTGSDQTVDVDFTRTGVIPHGAQAIHSAVFSGELSSVDPSVFNEANSDGVPDGTDDQASGILVPAGYSLLVTYHLTWGGLGNPVPSGCALNCDTANQPIVVIGTVSGPGISTESCTSGALGYKK